MDSKEIIGMVVLIGIIEEEDKLDKVKQGKKNDEIY